MRWIRQSSVQLLYHVARKFLSIARIADSQPPNFVKSFLSSVTTALPIIRRRTSPILTGLNLGFLSKGIMSVAGRASRNYSFTLSVYILRVTDATALHKSVELSPNDLLRSILFQPSEFMLDGPDPPLVLVAAIWMVSAVILSKITG